MTSSRRSRDMIIHALTNALKPLHYAHAFYEGGAIAFNRLDEWSDIDLYIVVDNDKIEEAFQTAEKAMRSLSPIKQKYDVPQTGWEGVSQAFYLLENTSEYLLIDLCILKLSSAEKFLTPEIHGNNIFYINKKSIIRPPQLDKKKFTKRVQTRLDRLQARFRMFNNFVQKEINRGNYLEAIDLYHVITLATLVELFRIKYYPFHHDFRMRYVHYELPTEAVKTLEHLYSIKGKKDLQQKYHQAIKLVNRLMLEIDPKEIEKLIKTS